MQFIFSCWHHCHCPPSWILIFLQYLSKNSPNLRPFLYCAKFGEDGLSAAELLRIFDFQKSYCSRPPSWILYDVIAGHPRLVFDGSNILLKLHVACVYTLQDTAIFIFGPFGLKFSCPILGNFLGYYRKWNLILSQPPKGPSLGEKTSYEP